MSTGPTAIAASQLEAAREASDERVAMALVDALFLLVGSLYAVRVLKPMPKTYLSEIAFPFDFCVKLVACSTLFMTHGLQWLYNESLRTWQAGNEGSGVSVNSRIGASELFAMTEALVWGMASTILWMEYRRSMTPSAYLRMFWLVKWIGAIYALVVFQAFTSTAKVHSVEITLAVVVDTIRFFATTVLALFCFVAPTPITVDMVSFSQDVLTPTALLHSQNAQRRFSNLSNYGSFRDYDWHLKAAFQQPANKDRAACALQPNDDGATLLGMDLEKSHASTRSSVVPAITVAIPSSTTSIWGKNQFVSYKIVVQTEDDAWTVRRHYADFATLHEELPEEIRDFCTLPPDQNTSESSSGRRKFLSWKGRPRSMKSKLESYLRLVLSHPALEPNSSQGLCDFLEMEYVEDALTRSYHSAPRI